MTSYQITADITVDLDIETLESLKIITTPMKYVQGDDLITHYADFREQSLDQFYARLNEGELSTTSQGTPAEFMAYFESIFKSGQDILHIAFSSGLSGSYNSAMVALTQLQELYPNRRFRCVDTLAASSGHGLLAYLAAMKRDEGLDLDTVADWLEIHKLNMAHWFTVSNLEHLRRGGRVSAIGATVGTALSIHPILHVDDAGRLIMQSKARGIVKAQKMLISIMEESMLKPYPYPVFISHSDDYEHASTMKKRIYEAFGIEDIRIFEIDPIIGSHTGQGTISIFFMAEHR